MGYSAEDFTRPRACELNAFMKTLFTLEAIPKGGRSEINQTPNGLPNVTLGNLHGRRPSLTGYGWPAQSGRSSVRGPDESALMNSQLG
jgi:hypothetical protein